jgi:hypothetical protein
MKPLVKIEDLGQTFNTQSGQFTALREISLEISKGEVVSLIGHSGCGKSTLLNLIAGLTLPTSGLLLCADREIAGPGPERAVVFQNHSLLPWMSCFENVMLGVEQVFGRREAKAKLRERVAAALEMKLVMVGNGMAGVRTLEELLKLAPDLYDITVFGAEPHPNYNRILLSPVLAGEMTLDDIMLNARLVPRQRHHPARRQEGRADRPRPAQGDRRRRHRPRPTTTACCWPPAPRPSSCRCRARTCPA